MNKGNYVWIFVAGVIVTILIAFNYQGGKNAVSLNEIFPDEETYPIDAEYEFMDQEKEKSKPQPQAVVDNKPITPEKSVVINQKSEDKPKTKPKPEPVSDPVVNLNNLDYVVQIASFKLRDKAEEKLKEVKGKGYNAFIVVKNLGDQGTWYRVYSGQFDNKDDAKKYLLKVQKDYKDSFIISNIKQ